jgi:hypothetical protein
VLDCSLRDFVIVSLIDGDRRSGKAYANRTRRSALDSKTGCAEMADHFGL